MADPVHIENDDVHAASDPDTARDEAVADLGSRDGQALDRGRVS